MVGSKRPWRLTHGQLWPEHRAHAPAPPLGTHPAPPGAGIGPTIQIGEETVITVDTKAAGKGKVTCTVCTPDGSEVDVDVVENEDGTFDIFYTAPQPGKYVICVRFGGEHVPNSPFQVTVRRDQGWRVSGRGPGSLPPQRSQVWTASSSVPCSAGSGWRPAHSTAAITASAAGATIYLRPGGPADLGMACPAASWLTLPSGTLADGPAGCPMRPCSAICEEGPQSLPLGTPFPSSSSLRPSVSPPPAGPRKAPGGGQRAGCEQPEALRPCHPLHHQEGRGHW